MKISGYGSISSTSGPKNAGKSTRTGNFAGLLSANEADETSPLSHTSEAAAAGSISNLLALQEISEDDVQRRKLMQQGKSLLDELERLRQHLLTGTLPLHVLRDLDRQLSIKRQFVADPALTELMDDIELRAAVELAKLEMAVVKREETPDN